jgi:competence protein ComEA
MKSYFEPVRNWFGHTRRERRASSILLMIIAAILSVRYIFPLEKFRIEDVSALYSDSNTADTVQLLQPITARDNMESHIRMQVRHELKADTQKRSRKRLPVNLNSCDSLSLMELPGIGPRLSARIIKYRNLLGGFYSIEQLREVYGLPEETFINIRERLYADTSLIKKIRINEAGYRELGRIPYIEKYEISAILKFRQLTGKINNAGELVENKILKEDKVARMKMYIDFR